jgi:acetyltransferase-like isoleucine patch superfamily enzyme
MVNEFFTKQGTIKLTLKRILLKDPYNYSFIDESSKLQGFKFCKKKYITIKSINNSKIIIGRNVVLKNVSINCNNNSELIIGDDVRIENAVIKLDNNSKCKLGNNCIIGSLSNSPLSFYLNNGQMQIGEMSKLMLDKIQVRFGGCLNIGRYGGFGNRSEIRCDQKIDIGNFCLCSYNVSIYDTNVHSVDPGKREEWIIDQFPQGLTDLEKPKTDPVILGDNLWIGKNAIILKGSEIASASVIGINAVLSNIKDKTPKTYVSNKPISF